MRAYLIDPIKETISEINFEGDFRTIQQILDCKSFTTGSRALRGNLEQGFDNVLVSDDYLDERDERYWFQVDVNRDPPSSFPIAGNGLVLGVDADGKECDAGISLDEMKRRITFTRRKFRGFTTNVQNGVFRVDVHAPLIDDR